MPRAKTYKLKEQKKTMTAPNKMYLLFTVVDRNKADFFIDILQHFEVNLQLVLSAQGTASDDILSLLGLADSNKSIIISAIKKDRTSEALLMLETKFKTVKGGKGIAFTVPIKSTIGVAIYQFLSNTANGGLI